MDPYRSTEAQAQQKRAETSATKTASKMRKHSSQVHGIPPPSPLPKPITQQRPTFQYLYETPPPARRMIRSSPTSASLAASSYSFLTANQDFLTRSAERSSVYHSELKESMQHVFLAGLDKVQSNIANLSDKHSAREDKAISANLAVLQQMAPTDHDSLPSVIGFEAPVFPPLASFGDLSPDAEAKEPASAIGFSLGNNPPADPCLTAAAVAPTRIPSQGPPAPARGFVSTFTTTVAAPSVAEAEPTLAPRLDGNGYFAFGLDSSPKGGFDFSVPPRAQGCALNTTMEMSDDEDL
jgi:hypothetical protein